VLLRTERYQEVQDMAITIFDGGSPQGWRTTVQKVLEAKFGPLRTSTRERLDSLGPERLEALALEALKAHSLQELSLED
jgi:hypothetical protein